MAKGQALAAVRLAVGMVSVRSIVVKVRAVRPAAAGSLPSNTGAHGGCRSRGQISLSLAFAGRTPAGFPVNSRGWSEGRATPPDPAGAFRNPEGVLPPPRRRGFGGMGPPRRGGGHRGGHFRGCARASRTPGYSRTTPPGLGWRLLRRPCVSRRRNSEEGAARPRLFSAGACWFLDRLVPWFFP